MGHQVQRSQVASWLWSFNSRGEQEALISVKKCLTENKAPVTRSKGRVPRSRYRAVEKGGPRPEPKEAGTAHRILERQPPSGP